MREGNKILDILYLFASFFLIGLLIYVLIFSLSYARVILYNYSSPSEQAYNLGIIIAIVTVIVQWIEGRIKAVVETLNFLQRRKRRSKLKNVRREEEKGGERIQFD